MQHTISDNSIRTSNKLRQFLIGTLFLWLISGGTLSGQEKKRYQDTTVYAQLRKRIVVLTDSINTSPSDTTLISRRGNLYFDTEQWKLAEIDFTRCITLAPGNFVYYYMRGSTRQRLSDFPGSFEDFTQVITLKPDYTQGWLDRGIILSDAGLFKEGYSDYQQALVLSPGWGVAYFQMGVSFDDRMLIDSAEFYYKKAIAADSTIYKAYYNLGRSYEQLRKDTANALICYDKALAIWPRFTSGMV